MVEKVFWILVVISCLWLIGFPIYNVIRNKYRTYKIRLFQSAYALGFASLALLVNIVNLIIKYSK
jgi:formate hydrogenlyase subunit 3/multisubunit Na+/H+ antiporter MnhD subunit